MSSAWAAMYMHTHDSVAQSEHRVQDHFYTDLQSFFLLEQTHVALLQSGYSDVFNNNISIESNMEDVAHVVDSVSVPIYCRSRIPLINNNSNEINKYWFWT